MYNQVIIPGKFSRNLSFLSLIEARKLRVKSGITRMKSSKIVKSAIPSLALWVIRISDFDRN